MESSGYQGIFYFFPDPKREVTQAGDNFLVPDPGPFLVPDPGLFLLWAEDMEGRSGLTLLLHTPVLSLTLVYIIFLVCSSQQLPDSSASCCSHGHVRHRCDFFIIRKELGKGGGGSGIIRVPVY